MRSRNWFWGTFFILGAILLGVSQMGLISYHLGFWTVIATLVLAGALIQSLIMLSIGGTVFSVAFLSILYAGPLGIAKLAPWTILGIAILLTIGLSIIFFRPRHNWWLKQMKNAGKGHHHWHGGPHANGFHHGGMVDTETVSSDATQVDIESRMSNSIRYVQGDDIEQVNIVSDMSGVKVYFEHADLVDDAVINVNARLSGIELYIPREWHIVNEIGAMLSGVQDYGEDTVITKTIYLRGQASLSGLNIRYV
ncbi:hypothetical protein FD04_GL000444 [Secundilactobacillus odoratitofui DSM 19909 = JCM 15043]|uniref:LiaF transmembrane domain-containing protein n=2 Tax=Secundilactobacillus odoratitofui TaxID=480930 RepID=A0A0R1LZT9_9LACO|nr:hypothetical protein [Secundilactobacillus odoratitofui]KRK98708.1 hypothetical protein FD04_GL000444 [Secundilactobacillus odoratitofui DSM 19909 = JCM 15043]